MPCIKHPSLQNAVVNDRHVDALRVFLPHVKAPRVGQLCGGVVAARGGRLLGRVVVLQGNPALDGHGPGVPPRRPAVRGTVRPWPCSDKFPIVKSARLRARKVIAKNGRSENGRGSTNHKA